MGLETVDHLVQVGVDAVQLVVTVGSRFIVMAFPGGVVLVP